MLLEEVADQLVVALGFEHREGEAVQRPHLVVLREVGHETLLAQDRRVGAGIAHADGLKEDELRVVGRYHVEQLADQVAALERVGDEVGQREGAVDGRIDVDIGDVALLEDRREVDRLVAERGAHDDAVGFERGDLFKRTAAGIQIELVVVHELALDIDILEHADRPHDSLVGALPVFALLELGKGDDDAVMPAQRDARKVHVGLIAHLLEHGVDRLAGRGGDIAAVVQYTVHRTGRHARQPCNVLDPYLLRHR